MREIRQSGSEGGEGDLPDPYAGCPNFCVRGVFRLTHHWVIDGKRRMVVTARPRRARLFLGSIKAPVPSSRPGDVPAPGFGHPSRRAGQSRP